MFREMLKSATTQELLDRLDYCGSDWDYRKEVIAEIKERLEAKERPKGKPIVKKEEYTLCGFEMEIYECPECKTEWKKHFNFCPNCGLDWRVI